MSSSSATAAGGGGDGDAGGGGSLTVLDSAAVRSSLPLSALIPHLRSSLPTLSPVIHSPARTSLPIDPPAGAALLLMPSYSSHPSVPYIGVKIVTSFPSNSSLGLPTIHAAYLLFHSLTGAPIASIDGTSLTLLRTAAIAALASQFLARSDSQTLLLVGAGALAPYLISAHLHVLPNLTRILIWNRTPHKAQTLARDLSAASGGVGFEQVELLDEAVRVADVVICATGSGDPLVKGGSLKEGAHLGMVGSFTPEMRECDDEALVRGRVFVDTEAAAEEAGELVGAFERGVMSPEDVVGTLAELVAGKKEGRRSSGEITVFKSVGNSVFCILAAQLALDNYLKELKSI